MLDRQSKIVQSTQPVLQEHGESITRVFYRHLLKEHPELASMFNARDQSDGSQARRLAATNSRLYGNLQEAGASRRSDMWRVFFWGILVKRYAVNV
jgi:nitric oxide dioxygenase